MFEVSALVIWLTLLTLLPSLGKQQSMLGQRDAIAHVRGRSSR